MKKHKLLYPALIALSACSMVPGYDRPNVDVPPGWTESAAATDATAVAHDWWKNFKSDELNSLMDEALANNNDLRAGLQRIEQSRAQAKIAGSNLLPSADLTAGASRSHATRPDGTDNSLRAGGSVSYELDLFGRNRADVESAESSLRATQYDYEALKLLVMSDVAQAYFNVLNSRERLRIADDNLKNSNEVLRIVQARYEAGASDALEVAQQKSELASTQAARASVEKDIRTAENSLAVLLGRAPQSLDIKGASLAALEIPAIGAGQPSSLLERRPDIRSAEALLQAANADIGVARAELFPTITLGLDASLASSGFGDPASTLISVSSGLLAPIFHGGALQANVQQATARDAELAENYRKTVLTSFQEVEDALASEKAAQLRETALDTAMQEARKSYELSRSRYDAGTIDFQTLLDAQRTLLSAEDAFATSKNERLVAAVTLYRALGGGWQGDGTVAAPAAAPAVAPVVAPAPASAPVALPPPQ